MSKKITLIFVLDGEPAHTAIVARSSTVAEVRQRWGEASVDVGAAVYFTIEGNDGAVLPEEGSLADILSSEQFALTLIVRREEEKTLRILGSQREPVRIRLQALETVQRLTERAKELLSIENREARLMSGGRVLDAEALASPQLMGCPTIELDLRCSFVVASLGPASRPDSDDQMKEAAGDLKPPALGSSLEVKVLNRFASEPARTLCGDGESRVTAAGSGKSQFGDCVLYALIPEDDLLSGRPVNVFLEQPIAVFVEDKLCGETGTRMLWPTTEVGELLSCSSDSVLIGGQEVSRSTKLWEAGLPDAGCLTITRIDSLSVMIDGSCRKVKADLSNSLGSLREQLRLPRAEFRLWYDGELLRQDRRSLLQLGIDSSCRLLAVPKTSTVFLRLRNADAVELGEVRQSISFADFVKKAAAALKTEVSIRTRFVCKCGRIFSDECAERRRLPSRCCNSKELHLMVFEPPKSECRSDIYALGYDVLRSIQNRTMSKACLFIRVGLISIPD